MLSKLKCFPAHLLQGSNIVISHLMARVQVSVSEIRDYPQIGQLLKCSRACYWQGGNSGVKRRLRRCYQKNEPNFHFINKKPVSHILIKKCVKVRVAIECH